MTTSIYWVGNTRPRHYACAVQQCRHHLMIWLCVKASGGHLNTSNIHDNIKFSLNTQVFDNSKMKLHKICYNFWLINLQDRVHCMHIWSVVDNFLCHIVKHYIVCQIWWNLAFGLIILWTKCMLLTA